MIHIFQYSFKRFFRNKAELFWILLFPILLGTMFKMAFGGITESEQFQAIPVAIVCDDSEAAKIFRMVADELGKEGENQFLDITYCKDEQAKNLLKNEKVNGILYVSDKVTLTLSGDSGSNNINSSILNCFVQQYHIQQTAIAEIETKHPENLATVVNSMKEENSYIKEVSLSRNKEEDNYTQYFYNLMAMSCLFTSMSGLLVAIYNQGNLSELGARKNLSPTHKLKSIVGELTACILSRFCCNLIAFFYVAFVLQVSITTRLPLAILALFISCLVGVTSGFFLGSIGKMAEQTQTGIAVGVHLFSCFLSGLMVGNMRQIVEDTCPIINKINPAALISDSFYSIATYDSLDRYFQNIGTLILWAIVFVAGGFFMTRRRKYASL